MKQKRQLFRALGLLLFLWGAYFISGKITGGTSLEKTGEIEESQAPRVYKLINHVPSTGDRFILENPGGSMELTFREGHWQRPDSFQRIDKLSPEALQNLGTRLCRLESSKILAKSIKTSVKNKKDWGLDKPQARVTLIPASDINGQTKSRIVVEMGGPLPTGSGFYACKRGDEELYLLPAGEAQTLLTEADDLKDHSLPALDFKAIKEVKIHKTGERPILLVPYYEHDPFSSSLSPFVMTEPYNRPMDTEGQKLANALEALAGNSQILAFVKEAEGSGLEGSCPSLGYLKLEDKEGRQLGLAFGNLTPDGTARYCRIDRREGIVLLPGKTAALLEYSSLELASPFVRLVNIDRIKGFTLESPQNRWFADLPLPEKEGKEGLFLFQGRTMEEEAFKKLYQDVLYLLIEGEVPAGYTPHDTPLFTMEFRGNESVNFQKTWAEFFDYDLDYFALSIDKHPCEFLVGKYQVNHLIDKLKEAAGATPQGP